MTENLGLDQLLHDLEMIVSETHPGYRWFTAFPQVKCDEHGACLRITSMHVVFSVDGKMHSIVMHEPPDFRKHFKAELAPIWDRIFAGA